MATFITGKTALAQSEENGQWFTLHNQLFLDDDDCLYFVPRYFMTDGYTIPKCLAVLGGSKMEWDIRAAIQHDFECKYHKVLKVKTSLEALKKDGYIREISKDGIIIIVCENLPLEYLTIADTTFNKANARFKRALKALNNIKNWRINMMRFAVNFNISWLWSEKELELDKIYRSLI